MSSELSRLVIAVGGDFSGFNREMTKFQKTMRKAMGSDALNLSKDLGIGLGVVAAGLVAVGGKAILTAGQFEMTARSFETLLGSGEKAREFLGQLQQFAATTPFEFVGLTTAAKKMLAYGFTAQQVLPLLTAVGDASSALGMNQEGIDRITLALGQIQAKGKLSAQEMNQLAETGLPAWDMVAKKLGVDIPTAMKMTERGAVSSKVAIEGIVQGIDKRFGGAMAKLSGEIPQSLSNIKDAFTISMIGIGDSINKAFDVKAKLADFAKAFSEVAQSLKNVGIGETLAKFADPAVLAGITVISGALIGAMVPALITTAAAAWLAIVPLLPWMALGAAIAGLAYVIIRNWDELSIFFKRLWIDLVFKGKEAFVGIGKAFLGLAETILNGAEKAFGWIPGLKDKVSGAKDKLKELATSFDDMSKNNSKEFNESIDKMNGPLKELKTTVNAIKPIVLPTAGDYKSTASGITKVSDAVDGLNKSVASIGDALSDTFADILTGSQTATEALKNLTNMLAKMVLKYAFNAILSTAGSGAAAIPAMADGGYVNRPTLALIGEAGPEYVVPENKMGNFTSASSSGALKVENNIINNVSDKVGVTTTATVQNGKIIQNIVLSMLANNTGNFKNSIKAAAR